MWTRNLFVALIISMNMYGMSNQPYTNTKLHRAARGGNARKVIELLAIGANAKAINQSKITPLHNAAASGNVATIKALMAVSDLYAKDDKGSTALLVALALRNQRGAVELIHAGAPVNLPGYEGVTPLYVAAKEGLRKAVTKLLEYGADPFALTYDHETINSFDNKIMIQLCEARKSWLHRRAPLKVFISRSRR